MLGGVGAIVGGMTGLGDNNTSVSGIDNIVSFSINDNKEVMVLLSCKDKKLKKVAEFLKRNLNSYYKNPVLEKKVQKENISVANELIKLKGLLEEGILTQDEFDKQKEKILNT